MPAAANSNTQRDTPRRRAGAITSPSSSANALATNWIWPAPELNVPMGRVCSPVRPSPRKRSADSLARPTLIGAFGDAKNCAATSTAIGTESTSVQRATRSTSS